MSDAVKSRFRPGVNIRVLGWALACSLSVHLLVYGAWRLAQHYGFFQNSLLSRLVQKVEQALLPTFNPKAFVKTPEPPPMLLNFAYVDPSQATIKPPDKPKYEAAVNSIAANPTLTREADRPQIDGTQDKVVRTTTSPVTQIKPKPPAETKSEPDKKPDQDDQKAQKAQKNSAKFHDVGNLAMAKKTPENKVTDPTPADNLVEKPPHVRPRRLSDVSPSLRGETMTQSGGVHRNSIQPSLDAKSSIVGNYENEFVQAVQQRWDELLGDHGADTAGKVVLEFTLHYNGRITDMRVASNEVGDYECALCQRAILDPSPFRPWPPEMRHELQSDQWHLRFTFYYELR